MFIPHHQAAAGVGGNSTIGLGIQIQHSILANLQRYACGILASQMELHILADDDLVPILVEHGEHQIVSQLTNRQCCGAGNIDTAQIDLFKISIAADGNIQIRQLIGLTVVAVTLTPDLGNVTAGDGGIAGAKVTVGEASQIQRIDIDIVGNGQIHLFDISRSVSAVCAALQTDKDLGITGDLNGGLAAVLKLVAAVNRADDTTLHNKGRCDLLCLAAQTDYDLIASCIGDQLAVT